MAKKYDYISFLESISSVGQEAMYAEILEYALKLPKVIDKIKAKEYFEKAYTNGSLGILKDRLDVSIECIDRQIDIMVGQQEIIDKLVLLKNNIATFHSVIEEVVQEKVPSSNEEDLSGKATSLKSFEEKSIELQGRLEKLAGRIEKYEGTLNDKLFSLIINTVAILGIFVAISFAGFGANTLFSQIVFDVSNDTIMNTFYLFLTALFVYNLLFLLFYCIFKIIEKISSTKKIGISRQSNPKCRSM